MGATAIGVAAVAMPSVGASAQARGNYRLVLKDDAGNEYLDDRFRYETNTSTFWVEDADVRFGSSAADSATPDFSYSAGSRKITSRSILCHEIGDSVDIGGGRAGPDDSDPYGAPVTTEPGARLVRFWGRSWVSELKPGTHEAIGWDGGADGEQFALCGETAIHADGDQTPTSRPGRVHLRSTRPGEHSPRDGLIVTRLQQVCAAEDGDADTPSWTFWNDRATGLSRLRNEDGRTFLNASVGGKKVAGFSNPSGRMTGLALAYVDATGSINFETVEVGPPDSGGAGFRMLRVPN
jgi:hypothetical protein